MSFHYWPKPTKRMFNRQVFNSLPNNQQSQALAAWLSLRRPTCKKSEIGD